MTIVFLLSDNYGTGIRITDDAYDSDYYIDDGVLFGSTNDAALYLKGTYCDVHVHGTVAGATYGVRLGDQEADDLGNALRVAAGGLVLGRVGAGLWGASTVTNGGRIEGTATGVMFRMDGEAHSRLRNEGVISGDAMGVDASTSGTSTLAMVNRGVISSEGIGLHCGGSSASTVRLTNFGTIEGTGAAYRGLENVDRLINRGEILGDVELGGGANLYDGRFGRILGRVSGDGGDDTFFAGAAAEDFEGGDGIDTLDFRGSAGLRVSLADDSGTGWAEGDSYLGFERVLGSRGGNDLLIGDDLANMLYGLGGVDTLRGGVGSDVLAGGAEADKLTGGLGDDAFLFTRSAQGGDSVLDFRNLTGNDDVFHIDAAGFGGGLVAGALEEARFAARDDNLAQDADDRFIFRSTDASLWFDADGRGGAAGVMLAKLQAGAVLTSADILLV